MLMERAMLMVQGSRSGSKVSCGNYLPIDASRLQAGVEVPSSVTASNIHDRGLKGWEKTEACVPSSCDMQLSRWED